MNILLINYLSFLSYVLLALRLFTMFISSRNERKLRAMGSLEFGKGNSTVLITAHFIYYGACLVEGFTKNAFYHDGIALVGFFVYLFSIVILYYVIYCIRHVWTVKLIVGPKEYHKINRNWLFRTFRHPNYFLNVIPELIGLAVLFHAWFTLIIGLPLYLIPLFRRINLEQKMLGQYFEDYK